jgi:hypothetical protein
MILICRINENDSHLQCAGERAVAENDSHLRPSDSHLQKTIAKKLVYSLSPSIPRSSKSPYHFPASFLYRDLASTLLYRDLASPTIFRHGLLKLLNNPH